MRKSCKLALAVIIAVTGVNGHAQVSTGTPWLGSFGGGPDVINLGNLNVNWTFPLINKPGRGVPFVFAPSYNSSIWYPVTSNGVTTWQPVTGWGWTGLPGAVGGALTYSTQVDDPVQCGPLDPNGEEIYQYTVTEYFNYVYTDYSGTQHNFPSVGTSTVSGQCYEGTSPPVQGTSNATGTDGQGYTLYAYPDGGTVTAPSGIAVLLGTPAAGGTFGSGYKEDQNGNYISVSNNVYTDTLGNQVTVSGSPTSPPYNISAPGPSGNVSYQVTYKPYTVQTAFNCPNNSPQDYGPSQISLVDRIILPDGRYYQFFYEPTTSGSANVTGRINGIKLPTDSGSGPTISYAYTGGDTGAGIMCTDGSTGGLTRTTPDGTWTYSRSETSATQWTTILTAPAYGAGNTQDQTVVAFLTSGNNFYEISRQTYSGSSTSGTLLNTVLSCYNPSSNCPTQAGLAAYPTTSLSLNLTGKQTTIQFPDKTGISSGYVEQYDAYGMVSERDTYDFGSAGSGTFSSSLLQMHTMLHAVAAGGNDPATGATIQNKVLPSKDYVVDGAGNLVSYVEYGHDEVSATFTSGVSNHSSGICSNDCGNITSVKTWISGGNPVANGIAGSNYFTTKTTYYDTGSPITSTDVNNNQTTYTYGSGSCNYAFATNTATTTGGGPVASLQASTQWNCSGGVPNSTSDVNGNATTYSYGSDPYWRPVTVTNNSTGAITNYGYQSTSSNTTSSSMAFNNNASVSGSVTTYDRLGRAILQQKSQGPLASGYDSVAVAYDSRGRTASQTLPYSAALGVYLPSNAGTTTVYDALGRTVQVTNSGHGYVSFSYSNNDVLRTVGPQATGENLKRRQLQYNGAGWLTSVCEITGGMSSAPAGSCGQSTAATGYLTQYIYDGGGKLRQSSQNSQSGSSGPQARAISYDGLGRKVAETIPEWSAGTGVAGNSTYAYDTDSSGSCSGNFPGDLVKKIDNAGNVTCFTYDGLHRPLSSQVVAGPYVNVTPQVHTVYDSATYNGTGMTNVAGLVAEAYTCTGNCTSKLTDIFFSASPITSGSKAGGVLAQMWESTPNSNGYFLTQDTYYPNGALGAISAQLGGTSILPSLGFTLDGEGRPYAAIDATNCLNLVAATFYNPSSAPTNIVYGNASTGASNDIDSFLYDPNTGRPTQFKYAVNPVSNAFNITGNLTWHPNGELNQLALTDANDASKNQTCAYMNDDLDRIASVNCGSSAWGQTFSYDAFGNIAKSGSISYQPGGYTAVTNQVAVGGFGTYDANGNQTQNTWASFAWNAVGQPVNVNGVSATYDALGRMVETGSGSGYTQFVFRPSGDKLAVVQSGSLVKGTIPLPGGSSALYNSAGLTFIRHKDWLGSSRLATTWNHGVYSKEAYAPFGETYNEAGTPDRSFTGQDQDTTSGVYDYLFRRYDSTAGRWLSPDPAGWAAVDTASPQSLDRYAYVQNDPMRLVDPTGQVPCYFANSGDWSDVSTLAVCGTLGGTGYVVNQSTTVTPNDGSMNCDASNIDNCTGIINSIVTTTIESVPPAQTNGPRSGYESLFCLGDALKSNGLSLALDAVGLLPEGGAVAGTFSLWHGAAAVSNGTKNLQAVKMGAGIVGTASSGNDGDTYGTVVGVASIGASLAKAAPIVGTVLSLGALGGDAYKTYQEQSTCVNSGKYN